VQSNALEQVRGGTSNRAPRISELEYENRFQFQSTPRALARGEHPESGISNLGSRTFQSAPRILTRGDLSALLLVEIRLVQFGHPAFERCAVSNQL